MKVSRRGILAGLLASGAAPAAAIEAKPVLPKPTFIKGQIMPRYRYLAQGNHHIGYAEPIAIIEYEIYDGKKFVPLNSDAGQQVVDDLS